MICVLALFKSALISSAGRMETRWLLRSELTCLFARRDGRSCHIIHTQSAGSNGLLSEQNQVLICAFTFKFVPSVNTVGEGLMSYTKANHQGDIQVLWPHFSGACAGLALARSQVS